MHARIRTIKHTHEQASMQTSQQTHNQSNNQTHMHACMHAYIHTHTPRQTIKKYGKLAEGLNFLTEWGSAQGLDRVSYLVVFDDFVLLVLLVSCDPLCCFCTFPCCFKILPFLIISCHSQTYLMISCPMCFAMVRLVRPSHQISQKKYSILRCTPPGGIPHAVLYARMYYEIQCTA